MLNFNFQNENIVYIIKIKFMSEQRINTLVVYNGYALNVVIRC